MKRMRLDESILPLRTASTITASSSLTNETIPNSLIIPVNNSHQHHLHNNHRNITSVATTPATIIYPQQLSTATTTSQPTTLTYSVQAPVPICTSGKTLAITNALTNTCTTANNNRNSGSNRSENCGMHAGGNGGSLYTNINYNMPAASGSNSSSLQNKVPSNSTSQLNNSTAVMVSSGVSNSSGSGGHLRMPAGGGSLSQLTNNTNMVQDMNSASGVGSSQQQPQQQQSPGGSGNNFQRLKVEDALSYLDLVKFKFGTRPQVYNDFLDIMKEFKSQSIDTPGVIQRVSSLFKGFPDLIAGFNTFLPPGYKIEVQRSDQGYAFQVSVSMPSPSGGGGGAGSLSSDNPHNQQQKMIMRGSGTINNNVIAATNTTTIAINPPNSIATSNSGLQPILLSSSSSPVIVNTSQNLQTSNQSSVGGSITPTNQQSTNMLQLHKSVSGGIVAGGYHSSGSNANFNNNLTMSAAQVAVSQALQNHHHHQQQHVTGGGGGGSNSNTDTPQNQPVQFNHAINYVNKIKNRFQDQPEKYKRFLDILHVYQKEQRTMKESSTNNSSSVNNSSGTTAGGGIGNLSGGSGGGSGVTMSSSTTTSTIGVGGGGISKHLTEQEVYSQVAELFENQSDLLAEFGQFLPDATSHMNPVVRDQIPPLVQQQQQPPLPTLHTSHHSQQPQQQHQQLQQQPQPQQQHTSQHNNEHMIGGKKSLVKQQSYRDTLPERSLTSQKSSHHTHHSNHSQQTPQSQQQNTPSGQQQTLKRSPTYPLIKHSDAPPPKKQKMSSLRDVSLAEAAKYGTLNDYAFFDKVRKAVRSSEVYNNFLRCLNLFNQEIISKSELLMVVTPFLSKFPELLRWFREFLGQNAEGGGGGGLLESIPYGVTARSNSLSLSNSVNNSNNLDQQQSHHHHQLVTQQQQHSHSYHQQSNSQQHQNNQTQHQQNNAPLLQPSQHSQQHLQQQQQQQQQYQHLHHYNQSTTRPLGIVSGYGEQTLLEIDLATAKRLGASYCVTPASQEELTCTGRTQLCREVLNDHWVSFPTYSEDSTFVSSRKTQYEEYMYRCEDERFELDVVIDTNASTIRVFEGLHKKMQRMSTDDLSKFHLDNCLGGDSPTLHQRALKRIYGEKVTEIIEGLKRNPSVAVPIVLRRLKAKEEEWRDAQKGFNKIWREQNEKYYLKSLDHQGINFKQTDVKALRSKSLFNEIETIFDERHEQNEDGGEIVVGPHIVLPYKDRSILDDAANLLIHHVKRQTGIQKSEKRRIKHLLRQFVPELFFHPKQQLTDDEREDEDEKEDADESPDSSPETGKKSSTAKKEETSLKLPPQDTISGSGNSNSSNSCTSNQHELKDTNKNTANIDEEKSDDNNEENDIKIPLHAQNTAQDEAYTLYMANNNWYVFLRLHAILCERLAKIYECGVVLATEETQNRSNRTESIAIALRLKPKPQVKVEDYYVAFLEMVKNLLDGNMDSNTYEDTLREMFGIHAYVAFTLDKVVSNAVRQLQHCVTERAAIACMDLFIREQKRGASGGLCGTAYKRTHIESAYQRAAERIVGSDENLFRIFIYKKNCRISIELLDTDPPEGNDGGGSSGTGGGDDGGGGGGSSGGGGGGGGNNGAGNGKKSSSNNNNNNTNTNNKNHPISEDAKKWSAYKECYSEECHVNSTSFTITNINNNNIKKERTLNRIRSPIYLKRNINSYKKYVVHLNSNNKREKDLSISSTLSSSSSSPISTSSDEINATIASITTGGTTLSSGSTLTKNEKTKIEEKEKKTNERQSSSQPERTQTNFPGYVVSDDTQCRFNTQDSKIIFTVNKDSYLYKISAFHKARKSHPKVTKHLWFKFRTWLKRWANVNISDIQHKQCTDWLMGRGENIVPNKTRVLTDNDLTRTPYVPYNRYKVETCITNSNNDSTTIDEHNNNNNTPTAVNNNRT